MYSNRLTVPGSSHSNNVSILGDGVPDGERKRPSVFLGTHQLNKPPHLTQVAPAFTNKTSDNAGKDDQGGSVVLKVLKPILVFMRVLGICPIDFAEPYYLVTKQWMFYSVGVFVIFAAFLGYIRWDTVEMVRSAEGRFEEAVIDYLFTVYLVPIVILPLVWYQSKKQAKVLMDISTFERFYNMVTNKELALFMGNKPIMITIGLPILSCATMITTHVTMAHFRFIQVVPYCFINTITYMIGGAWYVYCDSLGKTATVISEDFQMALKNIGPSSHVAQYRSLWLMLSKLIRDLGNAYGYSLTFLCLYLFLTITLTIYGLLSQIQTGFGVKDIGLTITATFAVALLFFICDEAHYASNCVRVHFQKKLLLVELTWINDDAQQEINMFLRATEMNPTSISLGGFFDVNRNLFKSLLATMVTYLVVLLQFQISLPDEGLPPNGTITVAPQLNSTIIRNK